MKKIHSIQTFFESFLRTDAPRIFITELLIKKLKKSGVSLSKKERLRLEKKIGQALKENRSSVDIRLKSSKAKNIVVDLDEGDLGQQLEDYHTHLATEIPKLVDEFSIKTYKAMKRDINGQMEIVEGETARFTKHLNRFWKKPNDLLKLLVGLSFEAGLAFSKQNSEKKETAKYNALLWLHSRACHISYEIVALLSSGFADGAMARWRALHEVNVVSLLLAANSDDLSERYTSHHSIESHREIVEYKRYYTKLGYSPPAANLVKGWERASKKLSKRYGKDFLNHYGWATKLTGKQKPNFSDLETIVNLNHLRPFYRLASYSTHASAKGSFFRLSSLDAQEPIMLSGASVFGLADPGQLCAISISQLTINLLALEADMDGLVMANVIQMFQSDTMQSFDKASKKVQQH